MNSAHRLRAALGVALVGTGVTAVAPAAAPAHAVTSIDVHLMTSADPDIVIDFVRHGETYPTGAQIAVASNGLPGFPLSGMPGAPSVPDADNGELQQEAVGNALAQEFGTPGGVNGFPAGGVAGIYGGYEQRMIETAQQFLTNEGYTYTWKTVPTEVTGSDQAGSYVYTPEQYVDGVPTNPPEYIDGATSSGYTPMDGFDEIGGGIFVHDVPGSIGTYLSELIGLGWVFGLDFLPIPGSNDWLGTQFEENFGGAVDAAYQDTISQADPVISATGNLTDVVFTGEGAILAWTLMNVDNPDLAILLPKAFGAAAGADLLPTTGQVQIEGNPTDGWTLLNFGGVDIPKDPGLLTDLVVDFRQLIVAPQLAVWNLMEAVLSGDGTSTIGTVLSGGLQDVGSALYQFPVSVGTDISDEMKNLMNDVAGGEDFSTAFGSAIIGLPA